MSDVNVSAVIAFQIDGAAALQQANVQYNQLIQVIQQTTNVFNQNATAAANTTQSMMGLSSALGSVGRVMAAAGAAIGAALGEAAHEAAKFQQQMTLLETQAGATHAQMSKLSDAVLSMASSVGTGPEELAKSLYHVVSAGVPAAQQLDVVKIAAEGAKVGMSDVEQTTNALVGTMMSGIQGFHGAAEAMGQLNAIVGAGNMRMQQLVGAIGTGILPAAATFGLTLRDVGAALATMTDLGMGATESATRLRMSFSLMAAPSAKAIDQFASIGLSATQLAEDMRKPDGLLVAIQDLKRHLENSGKSAVEQEQIISRAFGGGRSSAAIMALLGNADKLDQKYKQITHTAGDFQAAWDSTSNQAQVQFDKMKAAVEALVIAFGETLLPAIAPVAEAIANAADAVRQFAKAHPDVMRVAEAFGAVLSAVGLIGGAVFTLGATLATGITVVTHLNTALGITVAETGGIGTASFASIAGIRAMGSALYTALAPALVLATGIVSALAIIASAVSIGVTGGLLINQRQLENDAANNKTDQIAAGRYDKLIKDAKEHGNYDKWLGDIMSKGYHPEFSHALEERGRTIHTDVEGIQGQMEAKRAALASEQDLAQADAEEKDAKNIRKRADRSIFDASHPEEFDRKKRDLDEKFVEDMEVAVKQKNDELIRAIQDAYTADLSMLKREQAEGRLKNWDEKQADRQQKAGVRQETREEAYMREFQRGEEDKRLEGADPKVRERVQAQRRAEDALREGLDPGVVQRVLRDTLAAINSRPDRGVGGVAQQEANPVLDAQMNRRHETENGEADPSEAQQSRDPNRERLRSLGPRSASGGQGDGGITVLPDAAAGKVNTFHYQVSIRTDGSPHGQALGHRIHEEIGRVINRFGQSSVVGA